MPGVPLKGLFIMVMVLVIPVFISAQNMSIKNYRNDRMMGNYNYYLGDILGPSEGIQKILEKIRKEQNLKEWLSINPDKVNSILLGELGNEVLKATIRDTSANERMKEIMGGVNSVNLENFYRLMGYRYLRGLPIGIGTRIGNFNQERNYYGGITGIGNQTEYYHRLYGQNPYEPMMSLGSFMGMGTLMDSQWILDYHLADYLALSKEQAQKITDLKNEYEKKVDPLRSQLLDKRRSIFDISSQENIDAEALKKTDQEVANLLSSISKKETEYRIKVLGVLTPEQKKKQDYRSIMDYQKRFQNDK